MSHMKRFQDLLAQLPEGVQNCFDMKEQRLSFDCIEQYIYCASSGDAVLAKFAAAAWLREDKYGFDMIDAALTLDRPNRELIANWFSEPVLP